MAHLTGGMPAARRDECEAEGMRLLMEPVVPRELFAALAALRDDAPVE